MLTNTVLFNNNVAVGNGRDRSLYRKDIIIQNRVRILYQSAHKNKTPEVILVSSEKSSEKILRLISEDHSISAKEIAGIINITPRAVEKQIASLRKAGKIRRIGPAKGGYWEIAEELKK